MKDANRVTFRRLRIAAPYRLGRRKCAHPLRETRYSRWHWHPAHLRGAPYDRCSVCLRARWRSWERFPFGAPRWRKVLYRAQGRWRLKGRAW